MNQQTTPSPITSGEALKPCPFCGGPVDLEHTVNNREWWGVVCRNTRNVGGTCAIQQRPSASPSAAVERWNLRAITEATITPSGELPPLPKAKHAIEHYHDDGRVTHEDGYSAAEVQAYARAALAQRASAPDEARDAARWRAFVGSQRIKMQGSAGLNEPMPNNYAHMGLEIWTTFDRDYSAELLDQLDKGNALGRDWLTKYADIAVAALAAQQPADGGAA